MVVLTLPRTLQQRQLCYALAISVFLLLFMRQAWTTQDRQPSKIIQEPDTFVRNFSEPVQLSPSGATNPPEAVSPPPKIEEPPEIITREFPKIAKVTIALGDLKASGADRCLRTHEIQNDMHDYTHFIGTTKLVVDRYVGGSVMASRWTKHAYLLNIILTELQKPKDERLQWLFWFDADTMILNPHIKLETFIPPPTNPMTAKINFVISRNWDDINDGAFLIRVDLWSVHLLSSILAYPVDHMSQKPFPHEQDVLSYLLHTKPLFQHNWALAPHRWFNSFPVNDVYEPLEGKPRYVISEALKPENMDNGERVIDGRNGTDRTLPWKVLKGNMALHFAGVQHRKTWIEPWADRAEMLLPEWSGPSFQLDLEMETAHYWHEWRPHVPIPMRGHKPIDALGNDAWI